MNISGIRPSLGFYDYNALKINSDYTNSLAGELADEAKPAQVSQEAQADARAKQTFGSFEFANTFRPNEIHEMKGADSDLASLDITKAISDMKKDTVIHQYQFFVKDTKGATTAEGVRPAEDFAL